MTVSEARNWMTMAEAATKWSRDLGRRVHERTVGYWCKQGLIPGVVREPIGAGRYGRTKIPADATPPADAIPQKGRKRGPKRRVKFHADHLTSSVMAIIDDKLTPDDREKLLAKAASMAFDLAATAQTKLFGPEQNTYIHLLEHEQENLRLALDYYGTEPSSALRELELAIHLARFWDITGAYQEGRTRLKHALNRQEPNNTRLKAKGYAWAGHLAFGQDDNEDAKKLLIEALNVATALNDRETWAFILFSRASVAESEGDYQQAKLLFGESMEISKALGMDWLTGWSVRWLGVTYQAEGNYAEAKQCYQEYLQICEKMEHGGGIAGALDHLGTIARYEKQYDRARQLLQQALAMRMGGGNKWGVSACWYNIGLLEEENDRVHVAYICFQKALEVCQIIGEKSGMARALEGIGRCLYQMRPSPEAPPHAIPIFQAAEKLRDEVSAPRWQAEQILTNPIIDELKDTHPTLWKPLDQVEVAHVIGLLLPAPHFLITDLSTVESE